MQNLRNLSKFLQTFFLFQIYKIHNTLKIYTLKIYVRNLKMNTIFKTTARHGSIWYLGGGGLEFLSGPRIFFRTKSEQDYFFRRPFGPDNFFHNQKLHLWHIGFRDIYLCLIQAFATTSCLMHPSATTSYSNLRLSRQIHTRSSFATSTAVGTTRQLHSQLNTV